MPRVEQALQQARQKEGGGENVRYENAAIEKERQRGRKSDRRREKDSIMVRLPNPLSESSI